MSNSVLTPEDLPKLDITDDETKSVTIEEKERTPRRKAILFGITLILFLFGTMVAPAAVSPGTYDVTINYGQSNTTFTINLNKSISSAEELTTIELEDAELIYYQQYPYEPGYTLHFTVITNSSVDDLPIDQITGSISDGDIEHTFLGEKEDQNTIIYTFKLLSDTKVAMGLLFAISFLWLTELIPLAASSLIIPVVLVFLDIQTATKALSYFSEPIIFLFLAGFLMAEAMKRTKLDQFISYRLFSIIPPSGKLLLFSMMTLSAVFSMFMSNTAAVALLIPLAIQLLKGVEVGDSRYRKTMVLGIAYAASIGGIGSMIGTPPNVIAIELLKEFNPIYDISFVEWFLFGLPVVFIMLPIVFVYLWTRFKPVVDQENLKKAQVQVKIKIKEELQVTQQQVVIMLIFTLTLGLWLTSSFHGISTGIVALLAAVLLFIVGQLEESDLNVINWNALLTFGGGLSLGGLIIQTGLADFIGSKALFIAGLPVLLMLFLISLVGLILTAFASNTASAVIMVPIVMPLGFVLGISPVLLAVIVAIAASVDFAIVIGTPPTMMAYSTGLFHTDEIFSIGIVLDFIGLIVLTILSWLLFGTFADWIL